MRTRTLLYHDLVRDDPEESGFSGPAAARYKLTASEFAQHLGALRQASLPQPATAHDLLTGFDGVRFLLTVDDGGVSALQLADLIEPFNWRAHFFITTDRIGTRTFVSAPHIRMLHERGHVIGAHSHTHPYRISALPYDSLVDEWRRSTLALQDILGEPTIAASVPGGFFAPNVAQAAAAAGVKVLFTSEPTTRVATMHGCMVVGRFTIYRGVSPDTAADLASGTGAAALRQAALWKGKKVVKTAAAPLWEALRRAAFGGG